MRSEVAHLTPVRAGRLQRPAAWRASVPPSCPDHGPTGRSRCSRRRATATGSAMTDRLKIRLQTNDESTLLPTHHSSSSKEGNEFKIWKMPRVRCQGDRPGDNGRLSFRVSREERLTSKAASRNSLSHHRPGHASSHVPIGLSSLISCAYGHVDVGSSCLNKDDVDSDRCSCPSSCCAFPLSVVEKSLLDSAAMLLTNT